MEENDFVTWWNKHREQVFLGEKEEDGFLWWDDFKKMCRIYFPGIRVEDRGFIMSRDACIEVLEESGVRKEVAARLGKCVDLKL